MLHTLGFSPDTLPPFASCLAQPEYNSPTISTISSRVQHSLDSIVAQSLSTPFAFAQTFAPRCLSRSGFSRYGTGSLL